MAGRRTRVKICGITRPEHAVAAVEAGADAIGLVFYPPSPRAIDLETAAAICRELPAFVSAVGLFVDAEPGQIEMALDRLPLALLQFHGKEPPAECRRYGVPYLKALSMRPETNLAEAEQHYADAAGLLLDSYRPGTPGGTGESFNWSLIPRDRTRPLVLAGGLTPDNVGAAVAQVRPFAVDVSGGVEREPGLKDSDKIHAFLAAVRAADHS